MKHLKILVLVLFSAGVLSLLSCNSGGDNKTGNKTDSTANNGIMGPSSILLVRHKVADYNNWKSGYDAHDSVRLASGIHKYLIARGTEDSNMVMVAQAMDDVNKAKAFAASPDLKEVMKKAGVISDPMIDYLDVVMSDTTSITQTVRLMVKHHVKDWDAWKKVYDSDKPNRVNAGLTDRVLGHSNGDTHSVTIVFAVSDMAKAKDFIGSKAMKDKMDQAGVDGPPDFFFYRIVQKY
jgi:hypothetical protein